MTVATAIAAGKSPARSNRASITQCMGQFDAILSLAEARDKSAFRAFVDGLTADDARFAAAEITFALAHAAVAQFAREARGRGYAVALERRPATFRLSAGPARAAACSCWIEGASLLLEYWGGSPVYVRQTVDVPASLELVELFASARALSELMSKHVLAVP